MWGNMYQAVSHLIEFQEYASWLSAHYNFFGLLCGLS